MAHFSSFEDLSRLLMEQKNRLQFTPIGATMRKVPPVDIAVRNLSVTVDTRSNARQSLRQLFSRKPIATAPELSNSIVSLLDNVSTDMPCGSLTAIIGASGSGKTTLLNVLTRRSKDTTTKVTGSITFNGSSELKSSQAYVTQQDQLIPSLTVRENLQYSAELRLPESVSAEERNAIVEQTILELSLKECASTRIGTSIIKGCSGGEKRRTSIGIQLLQNPSVLFADEPTTGLDSTSAHQIVQTLKNFAEGGRTVIAVLHQPRSEIWELFDRVIILARGSCVYSGETRNCLPYFSSLGYKIPQFVNPADFLIDLVAVDSRTVESERIGMQRFLKLKSSWAGCQTNDHSTSATFTTANPFTKVSPWRQFLVMTRRSALVSWRDPKGLAGTIAEAIIVGIILGWTFYKLDESLQGIRSRQGAFYAAAAVQGYLVLIYEVHRAREDVSLFDKEYCEGVVDVAPYILSRRAAKLIEDILTTLFYSLIFYSMVGLRAGASHFFFFWAILVLVQLSAVSVSFFAVSVFRDFIRAAMIAFAVFGYSTFAGGCFIPADLIPVYVNWVKWISYVFYAYGALNNNEFLDRTFPCKAPSGAGNVDCNKFSGTYQLRASGISLKRWQQITALLGLVLAFNIASGIIFTFFPAKTKASRNPYTGLHPAPQPEFAVKPDARRKLEAVISLRQYSLNVQWLRPWGSVYKQTSILKPLSTTFEQGKLNVIMGPSGSSKTSLLSSLAGRSRNSLTTRYMTSGEVLVNGLPITSEKLALLLSSVPQHDEGLLPSLTVRETLRFAASLRLPDLSHQAKHERAEELLLRLGLKNCANTIIGSDIIKGISGGEKRRVTIAIQLLTDPQVLLLDEPTSGLDGFTASSIIQILAELAAEGRTIILTIHQNRSDLSDANILLLARGGQVAYAGPGTRMIPHFQGAGYECNEHTNPGDFVLDLISTDLRDERREAESSERVRRLLALWSAKEKDQTTVTVTSCADAMDCSTPRKISASFTTALPILLQRSALNVLREKNAIIARITNVVPYGILIALFFAPLHEDYQAISTRLGLIQIFCFLYFLGLVNNTGHYPLEKSIMDQEIEEGAYTVIPFLVSFTLLELPFTIVSSFLTMIIAAYPLGIRNGGVIFAIFFNMVALLSCGESLAMALNSIFSDSGFSLSIADVLVCIAQTMAGVLSINMPGFLKAVNHISPISYVARNLAPYLFRGVVFDCSPEEKLSRGNCVQTHGDDILRLYKLDYNPRIQLGILAGVVVGYRLFAFLVLYLKKRSWRL